MSRAYWVVLTVVAVSAFLNYEVGYQNGQRDCYGCGLWADAPIIGNPWGPWFVEE